MTTLEAFAPTTTIPFDLAPGGNALVVHAHPDDETILTGQAIADMSAAGVTVHTIIATDGEQSTKGDPGFVQRRQRRHEARSALQTLGVAAEQQSYLAMRDAELSEDWQQRILAQAIARTVTERNISVILTPGTYGYDGHDDHQAVHRAALLGGRQLARRGLAPVIWELAAPGQASDTTLEVDSDRKLQAAVEHRSQFNIQPFATPTPRDLTIAGLGLYIPLFHQERYARVGTVY